MIVTMNVDCFDNDAYYDNNDNNDDDDDDDDDDDHKSNNYCDVDCDYIICH
jgi:hypothetical protein